MVLLWEHPPICVMLPHLSLLVPRGSRHSQSLLGHQRLRVLNPAPLLRLMGRLLGHRRPPPLPHPSKLQLVPLAHLLLGCCKALLVPLRLQSSW